ncbi:MAG: right-handed parallel beta-helix repeat-containing protein [Candidatus Poribacteria bacterium]|nr:right-handed parallel beta-helix repeat-containing protein [Candidatus Poribacteria bacterium]
MDYYVSLLGDDSNSGSSETQPWRSIDRVNAAQLLPGDSIWFRADQTFSGNLGLADVKQSSKQTRSLVTIGSYGSGRATIDAGYGVGFIGKNRGGVHLVNLNFVGAGASKNTGSGISFINTLSRDTKLSDIRIHQVDVSGFKYSGISLVAQPTDRSWSGFRDVKITNTTSHDNGDAGISCIGAWNPEQKGYAHADFYIGNCSAYRNAGIPGKGSHSGNGIVLAQVDGAIIEHCRAYENGSLNDYEGGGPVGIWAWDANRVVIQFNESHHNRTGSSKDGAGFDLDGGVTNSVVQYNYSHDNDGAGYLLAQFEGAPPFYGNVLRYNLSVNDGRRNRYGGIHLWSTGANGGITDTTFYANSIYTAQSANGNPAAVDCSSKGIRNIRLYNNCFQTDGKTVLVRGETNRNAIFEGNSFRTNYRFPRTPVEI